MFLFDFNIDQGDIYSLGPHRLMCGDSTNKNHVEKLMRGDKAQLVFTDPPYGMRKGIKNDNLNADKLLEFNKQWIPISFDHLTDTGSWYCWGIDEPLMDIYSEILKPMKRQQRITFRNLITWDKGSGQGQNSPDMRMYAPADEKCLFVMCGVQGFNTNSDNYFEGWEPIRKYLYDSRTAMGWDIPTMKRIVGHSDLSRDHWTGKSQWSLIPEYAYKKLQEAAEKQRAEQGLSNDAFKRDYEEIKRDYEEIKRDYEEIKRDYYGTRAYFDNTHENMNSVWHDPRTTPKERESLQAVMRHLSH